MSLRKKMIGGVALALSAAMMLAGCGSSGDNTAGDKDDNSFMKVDVYDDLANYQGVQKGWFAKVVKDKFNMQLNYISPNVAGGGTTLFDTRTAAGNLGDIIISTDAFGRGAKLAKTNLISDMTPYLKGMNNIKKYKHATDATNKVLGKTSGVWGIPNSLSDRSPSTASESVEPTYGPYLRWDLYKEVGYPKINTFEDLLPVLKKMQTLERQKTGDNKVYALSLFKDWDGDMMTVAKGPANLYGYDQVGFELAKADGSDYEPITAKNGIYEKALKFFYEANKAGIVDPDSTTQNYDTLLSKYKDGKVLFSFWPWAGQNAYNTPERTAQGKGFMIAPMKDQKIYSKGATPDGGITMIALGSKAKNKPRLVKFIDWLYSPEGIYDSSSQDGLSAGPKGLNWKVENGKPVLTAFGEKVINGGSANVPKSYGGGSYSDGMSKLNFPSVLVADKDPGTGYTYTSSAWPSVLEKNNDNPLHKDWPEHMGGAKTTMEYLEKNKMIDVAPGATVVPPLEDSKISTIKSSIRTEIVNSSWKASFAGSDAEFQQILSGMRSKVEGLGLKDALAFDLKNAKDQDKSRKAIVKEFANKKSDSTSSSN
ncbi:ABC transporter substrate-binding protein [Bifidobacterium sp. ESL0800]|uniref:ABC transporter substrate-binding protein n=1 Tax=Bifidobacterium sp. ESL0800 TaxID=2983236 RepID=UPI0023F8A329|nr:ABC transporter substrate-binding protein [Bifidobacterium sp. ESL0800]WEV74981.1 ABC transporter substrate-binding protein [Bifidobacterium sp. ESL0800]